MKNQPRDVLGGESFLRSMVPGMGLMDIFLSCITVLAEVFLRKNMGERYFTRQNFFAGVFVLLLFNAGSYIFGLLNGLNPLLILMNRSSSPESWLWAITKLYFIVGLWHFGRRAWLEHKGKYVHSFSAGTSRLLWLGKAIMLVANIILGAIVGVIDQISNKQEANESDERPPVIRDVHTFTERFVEPFFLLVLAYYASKFGQSGVATLLFFAVMALNFTTGMRHQAERALFLDFRDQALDASAIEMFQRGEDPRGARSLWTMANATVTEAERNPAFLNLVKASNPNLAEAMAAISPKLRKIVNPNLPDTSQQAA